MQRASDQEGDKRCNSSEYRNKKRTHSPEYPEKTFNADMNKHSYTNRSDSNVPRDSHIRKKSHTAGDKSLYTSQSGTHIDDCDRETKHKSNISSFKSEQHKLQYKNYDRKSDSNSYREEKYSQERDNKNKYDKKYCQERDNSGELHEKNKTSEDRNYREGNKKFKSFEPRDAYQHKEINSEKKLSKRSDQDYKYQERKSDFSPEKDYHKSQDYMHRVKRYEDYDSKSNSHSYQKRDSHKSSNRH